MIVKLEDGCWLADWDGDPGRTCVESHAMEFKTFPEACLALRQAQDYRPFTNSRIVFDGIEYFPE